MKIVIFQLKTPNGSALYWKNFIFFNENNYNEGQTKSVHFSNFHIKLVFIEKLFPWYIGYRPEFSFELK